MKILIVDRDEVSTQLIKSKLLPAGHQVSEEKVKNNAVEKLSADGFDAIFIDPSPLNDARPVVMSLRRAMGSYPYIFLMMEGVSRETGIKAGANDILAKPLDSQALSDKMANAERLLNLVRRIGDDSEDFPSAGGVIAKSAFNQLFLSGIDRAERYGESTFVLFITMSNYQEIRALDGPYAADYAVAKLSQYLVRFRRQSDIIGQTAKYEYALLLQRPLYENEPMEAANRFAEALSGCGDIISSGAARVEITISLIDLPSGARLANHVITPGVPA